MKLNDIEIKNPTRLSIERYNLTEAGRLANGLMVMDFIAKKRRFNLQYEVISAKDMNTILDILDTEEMFHTLEYVENDVTKTATVYVGAIPSDKFRSETGSWYWRNMNFALIER